MYSRGLDAASVWNVTKVSFLYLGSVIYIGNSAIHRSPETHTGNHCSALSFGETRVSEALEDDESADRVPCSNSRTTDRMQIYATLNTIPDFVHICTIQNNFNQYISTEAYRKSIKINSKIKTELTQFYFIDITGIPLNIYRQQRGT